MRFSGLLCGIRAKICSEKTWLKFVAMSAFNIPSPCPLPQEGGEVRAAALDLLRGFAPQPRSGLLCGINGAAAPVKQGGLRSTALSRCTDATTLTVDDLHGGFAPQPRLVSTVCLTYKINYSIIRGKMQVKFSGENHGFLWQNVK